MASRVQLREKQLGTREMLAERARCWPVPAGVPLIINDRVDVALAAGADGGMWASRTCRWPMFAGWRRVLDCRRFRGIAGDAGRPHVGRITSA